MDTLLILNTPESYLRSSEITFLFKWGIFSLNILVHFCWITLVLLLAAIPHWSGKILASIFSAIILYHYGLSWQLYKYSNEFMTLEGILFFIHNPVQLTEHLIQTNLKSLVLLSSVTLLLSFGLFLIYRLLSEKLRPIKNSFSMIPIHTFLLLIPISSAFFYYPILNKSVLFALQDDISPGVTLTLDLLEDTELPDDKPHDLILISNKQIPLKDYIKANPLKTTKPVIVLLIESLRSDVLRNNAIMPHLKQLSEDSVLFKNGITTSSHSDYADPSVFSSHYPLRSKRHHYYPKKIPYPRVMLYDILKAYGYKTALFSAQNENWSEMRNYLDSGSLDVFFDSNASPNKSYVPKSDTGFMEWFKKTKNAGKLDDGLIIDEAIRWIKGTNKTSFFLYLNLQRSHFPYTWPENFTPKFKPYEIDFPITFVNYPQEKIPVMRNRYFNSLAYIDEQLGKLISFLKQQNLYDKVIFVVSGDTGQAFYEHGFPTHGGALYNEVIRVPIMVKDPSLASAQTREETVSHIDIAPTILNLLGLKSHPSFQGFGMFQNIDWKNRPVFSTAQTSIANQNMILLDNWKFIYDSRKSQNFLYHLSEDPGETKNLRLSKMGVTRYMKDQLQAWMNSQLKFYSEEERFKYEYPPKIQSIKKSPQRTELLSS